MKWLCIFSCCLIADLFCLYSKIARSQPLLSTGDEIELNILNDEQFSGTYSISDDGFLEIPHLSKTYVNGLEIDEVLRKLKQKFVEEDFFVTASFGLSLKLKKQGSILVSVSGNVYSPGEILLVTADAKLDDLERFRRNNFNRRYLRDAIKRAGGIMPTADISRIILKRGDTISEHDLSGVFSGKITENVELITGDQIFVPKGEFYNDKYAVPSLITYDEIPVHLVTWDKGYNDRTVIYGSRLSQVLSATECLDRNQFTSGLRKAIVVRDYPVFENRQIFKLEVSKVIGSTDKKSNITLHPHDVVMCSNSALDLAVSAAEKATDIIKQTWPFTDYMLKQSGGFIP